MLQKKSKENSKFKQINGNISEWSHSLRSVILSRAHLGDAVSGNLNMALNILNLRLYVYS